MPPKADRPASGEQSIETLQKRFADLNTQKIRAESALKHAQDDLNKLKTQAREKHGTEDVAELRQKLETMTAENEAKRSQYQKALDQIESDLLDVEQKFAASEGGNGLTEAQS
jgi:septation ring formation regulator EzrA